MILIHSPKGALIFALALMLLPLLSACNLRGDSRTESSPDAIFIAPTATGLVAITHPAPDTPRPPTPTAAPAPTQTPEPSTGGFFTDPSLPRSQISMSVDFDYPSRTLEVFETLTYVNRSEEAIGELVLIVEPNRWDGAFRLKALRWASGAPLADYSLEDTILTIPLPEPLPPWKSVGVEIDYELQIPPNPGTFGYTERQVNLSNWYPFPPLYAPGKGWLAHDPALPGVGEYLTYEIADYDIQIQILDPPPGLTLAASVEGVDEGGWHFYQVQAARNFTLSASPDYITLVDETGFVKVISHVFPEHQKAGQAAMEATVSALELYAELFGPLSHDSLTVVEAEFADGMEYDGLYFLGQGYYETYFGGPLNFLTTLAAHETAHQWWYSLVANDQAMEPWLDEALATYSEALFYERYYPEQLDWWWEFRIGLYEPEGSVDSTIYDHEGFRPYVNAVYLRGAQFLQALRSKVGDKDFFAAIKSYLIKNSYADGTTDEFFDEFRFANGRQLDLLGQDYFSKTGEEFP